MYCSCPVPGAQVSRVKGKVEIINFILMYGAKSKKKEWRHFILFYHRDVLVYYSILDRRNQNSKDYQGRKQEVGVLKIKLTNAQSALPLSTSYKTPIIAPSNMCSHDCPRGRPSTSIFILHTSRTTTTVVLVISTTCTISIPVHM